MGKKGSSGHGTSVQAWMDWDEYQVGSWMKQRDLAEEYVRTFVENGIQGRNLPDCLDEAKLSALVDKPFWRMKMMGEISLLITQDEPPPALDTKPTRKTSFAEPARKISSEAEDLPPGKQHHFFGSHQKEHSVYGDTSESLGIRIKDIMEEKFGLSGWFDLDNLHQIDMKHIEEAILASCCVLVLLTDETKQSKWCRDEWHCAKDHSIPLIVVVDIDKFPARQLIKSYIEDGYDFLFANQCINYSSTYRKACYSMVAQAIEGAINQYNAIVTVESKQTKTTPVEISSDEVPRQIHATNIDASILQAQLKQHIYKRYGGVSSFFNVAKGKRDEITRTGFKTAVSSLALTDAARKQLRRQIAGSSKVITLAQLCAFIDGRGTTTAPKQAEDVAMCQIPREVPELPDKCVPRDAQLQALVTSLVEDTCTTGTVTSLTAPKARNAVTSQGMGGCGKTTLTIMALRTPVVRHHFERIAWQACSQTPQFLEIQTKIFKQLFLEQLPDDAATDADLAFQQLQERSKGRTFLVVLDDVWDSSVEKQLNFLDESTASRLLISTRIRGLIRGAAEVQLALLSPTESVEMLMKLSGVDNADASAELIQISNICGRLPLTIGIAAGMIQSLGREWEGNVLAMLNDDMNGSMEDESEAGLNPAEVIVTTSLKKLDENTQKFFTTLGVVPEDVVAPVPVICLIWKSQVKKGGTRQLLKVRKMTQILLRYNLCLGTLETGVHYHDIVRDVARGAIGNADDLRVAQRQFIAVALVTPPLNQTSNEDQAADNSVLQTYFNLALSEHMKEALLPPQPEDELLRSCLHHAIDAGEGFEDLVADSAASVVGVEFLAKQAESLFSKGSLFEAAKLFGVAACVETMTVGAVRAQQLMNRCAVVFQKIDKGHNSELCRTLEFVARSKVHNFIPWSAELYSTNISRMMQLYDSGVHIGSPIMMVGTAIAILYSIIPEMGQAAAGVGNQRNPVQYSKGSKTLWKCAGMTYEASTLSAGDELKRGSFYAFLYWIFIGSPPTWFLDPEEVATILTPEKLAEWSHNWDRSAQSALEQKIGGFEYSLMFHPALLQLSFFGALDDASTTIDKMIAAQLETPFTVSSDPSTEPNMKMCVAIATTSPTSFVYRVAGMGAKSVQFIRATGLTFKDTDLLYDTFLSVVIKGFFWEAGDADGQVCVFNSPEFFRAQHKRRHWLLEPAQSEQTEFRNWLPAANNQHGLERIDNSASYGTNGGDGPDVFMELGHPREAAIAAKLDLAYFPFNPFLVFHTSALLGKSLASSQRHDESNAIFEQAMKDARRLQMVFWEGNLAREWAAVRK